MKKENIFTKNSIPKSPCVIEMSDIDFGQPGELFRTYKHSPCAEIFHRNLKEKAGIEAVATFAYGNLKLFPQIQLYVWVKDSEAAEQILKNTPYQSCRSDHPLFRTVMECLFDALQEEGNQAFADISELWEKQQLNDANGENQIYVSITLLSYIRCYTDDLLGAAADAVSQAFAEHFPSYENLECFAFSLENFSAEGGRLSHNHLYLFMTPQDQERAEDSGDVEKMRKLAYDIVSEKDIYGYITYEDYMPQVTNRRMLTGEQIFHIARG